MKGLTDPVVGLLMGQTAENLAWKLRHLAAADGSVQRAQPSARRRRRALPGTYGEIVPLVDATGHRL
jgi:acetyl-CoA C-acetyltransferase